MGYSREDYEDKPVIAVINTWSDINPCHSHFRACRGGQARRVASRWLPCGDAGDVAVRAVQKPTTMLYRNFLAMETEELLRSYPADGCVLMGGCDKTTPGLIMGAVSMNLHRVHARRAHAAWKLARHHAR
jgi:dihydroxy-acid dehydratase